MKAFELKNRDDDKAVAVSAAVVIKVQTLIKERRLNRDNPQTPWPEVQPLPNLVPKPTRKAATNRRESGMFARVSGTNGVGMTARNMTPPHTRPLMKAAEKESPAKVALTAPLMPVTFPFSRAFQ